MCKIELMGIGAAGVFAALGFSGNGVLAVTGTIIFAIGAALVFVTEEENKRKSFLRTKKTIIRKKARI